MNFFLSAHRLATVRAGSDVLLGHDDDVLHVPAVVPVLVGGGGDAVVPRVEDGHGQGGGVQRAVQGGAGRSGLCGESILCVQVFILLIQC